MLGLVGIVIIIYFSTQPIHLLLMHSGLNKIVVEGIIQATKDGYHSCCVGVGYINTSTPL